MAGYEVVEDKELLRSEYYNDLLRRYEMCHVVGGFFTLEDGQIGSISSFRSLKSGHFPESTLHMMRLVLPHFERAAKLHSRLSTLQVGFESLDLLGSPMFVVRPDGEVWQMNSSARELLANRDGFQTVFGRLTAMCSADRSPLQSAIAKASAAAMGNGLDLDGRLLVHRASGKRPLIVLVNPVRSSRIFNNNNTAGPIVFITDPEREPALSAVLLRQMYGLTSAQSRLAIAIALGRDLDEFCAEAHVRRSTARAHLRIIFDKLGVRRQAELTALVLNTQSPIRVSTV